jgi:phage shock protein C
VSAVLLGMPFIIFLYVAAWVILDKKSANKGHVNITGHRTENQADAEISQGSIKVKARIWQSGEPPKQAFHDIRRKFKSLERQLQMMEQYVTSSEFTISREINKL